MLHRAVQCTIRNFALFHQRLEIHIYTAWTGFFVDGKKSKQNSVNKKCKRCLYDSNVIRFFYASLVRFTLFKSVFTFRIIIRMKAELWILCIWMLLLLRASASVHIISFLYIDAKRHLLGASKEEFKISERFNNFKSSIIFVGEHHKNAWIWHILSSPFQCGFRVQLCKKLIALNIVYNQATFDIPSTHTERRYAYGKSVNENYVANYCLNARMHQWIRFCTNFSILDVFICLLCHYFMQKEQKRNNLVEYNTKSSSYSNESISIMHTHTHIFVLFLYSYWYGILCTLKWFVR